jgi:nitroreductase
MMYDLMCARRSIRRFKPDPVPKERLEQLIEAAVTAPSASNKQPWRFLLVTKRSTIEEMVVAVKEAIDRIACHIPEGSVASFRTYGDYFTRFSEAPTVVVPIWKSVTILSNLTDRDLPLTDRGQIEAMENDSGLIGTSLALQNLLLMAHESGLGASAMTGPLIAAAALKTILSVPDRWGIVALVPVGFPDEHPAPTDRKPIDKCVRWIT